MSTRERWIVYPLLFLTLGIVMRDKIIPRGHLQTNEVTAERIHCGRLQVDQVASAGGIAVGSLQCGQELVAGKLRCGELVIVGPNGRSTVVVGTDSKTKGGSIATLSPNGVPLVLLQPTDSGGVIFASDVKRITGVAPHQNPKAPTPPTPKKPSKESEKAPVKPSK
jgi:hypothetical protein